MSNLHFWILAFSNNSLLTEPSAPTARPPADGSLRSPTPPAARPHHSPLPFRQKNCRQKFGVKKNFKKIRKNFEKKKKNRENFFFEFSKIFSVEIFHMMSRLRMQNFTIIGQGVPEIRGGTDKHTNLRIYYIDGGRGEVIYFSVITKMFLFVEVIFCLAKIMENFESTMKNLKLKKKRKKIGKIMVNPELLINKLRNIFCKSRW